MLKKKNIFKKLLKRLIPASFHKVSCVQEELASQIMTLHSEMKRIQNDVIRNYKFEINALRHQNEMLAMLVNESRKKDFQNPTVHIENNNHSSEICIVFICDDAYVEPTSVAITSLLHNKRDKTKVKIFVLGVSLCDENKKRLKSISPSITVVSLSNLFESYQISHEHVSKAALYKFQIADILKDYSKALYLDCDILIMDDLSDLWETDISNVYAAVVKDMHIMVKSPQHYQKMNHVDYFNSGVMLLNLERMREDNIASLLLANKLKYNNTKYWDFMDQDSFNLTFNNQVKYISPKYNWMVCYAEEFTPQEIAEFFMLSIDEARNIYRTPVVLHIGGRLKPWDSPLGEKYVLYEFYRMIGMRTYNKLGDHLNVNPIE
jgi:lipopolysaccharide biosynthesis glycosyltransferase